jgi:hypothetical protein
VYAGGPERDIAGKLDDVAALLEEQGRTRSACSVSQRRRDPGDLRQPVADLLGGHRWAGQLQASAGLARDS